MTDILDHQRRSIAYVIDGTLDRALVEPSPDALEKADVIITLLRGCLQSYTNASGYALFMPRE